MAETDSALRGLIRLLPAARALRDEAEKSVHMELPLNGDLAAKSLKGLAEAVTRLTQDAYVQSLSDAFAASEYSSDKEKVTAVLFVASQLTAYIEGEVGATGGAGGGHNQYAPYTQIMNVSGMTSAEMLRLAGDRESDEDD